jgi:hypothetical protein
MAATPKNAPTKPAATAAAAPAKPAAKAVTPAERQAMIAEAAYFIAQKRGFGGGKESSDWIQAEQQVDAALKKRS